jgi:hypothetical protein
MAMGVSAKLGEESSIIRVERLTMRRAGTIARGVDNLRSADRRPVTGRGVSSDRPSAAAALLEARQRLAGQHAGVQLGPVDPFDVLGLIAWDED